MKTSFLTASKAFLRYNIDPNNQNRFKLRNRAVNQQRKLQDDPEVKVKKQRLTVNPSTNGHLSTTATFLADSPYTDSRLNVCTKATFFCPQGGRCGQVQIILRIQNLLYVLRLKGCLGELNSLYSWLDSKTGTILILKVKG